MSNTEVVPVDNLAVRPNKLRERLFTVGYLTSCAVAMIGIAVDTVMTVK